MWKFQFSCDVTEWSRRQTKSSKNKWKTLSYSCREFQVPVVWFTGGNCVGLTGGCCGTGIGAEGPFTLGLGMPPQHGLLTPVSETVKVDAHICSGEDGHSKHRASENIVRLFRPSWKPKRLLKKNLDRRLCMGDWFVYDVRVHKKDANYLRIRVSQWAWKTIQLTPWRKYSVVKLRSGSFDMLKNENLSKNEGKFSNKKNFKGERFLIWSKRKEFNQTSFKRLGDIKFELLNKQALRKPRQYFQKVSQMCG